MKRVERRDRTGSDAGRGFRYQDSVAAALAVELWLTGEAGVVVPEGGDDIELRRSTGRSLVSVKSRRETRGPFTASELRSHVEDLRSRGRSGGATSLRLILERNGPPSECGTGPAGEGGGVFVDVMPNPMEDTVRRIEVELGCFPAAARVAFAELRFRLAECASENGPISVPDRKGLTGAEVSRIVSEAAELIDRNELEEARREGLVDAVDFLTPRPDDAFYLGVDVQPGHVAAGLTVSRPEEEAAVVLSVKQRGRVLICGPSGAGKSAIMWQAAAASRDAVRWYRLYDLERDDLPQLARYLRALRVAPERPVGLILDDVGRRLSGAWARATDLADRMPGLVLLGSCREEDMGQIGTLASVQLVRPLPNDGLAEALWRKLSEEGQTDWQGWAEPWEQSRGLLMEYAHLLSSRTRLRSVIRDQVGMRIADEQRDHETDILRVASCAGASGARLEPSSLRAKLGLTAGDTARF